MKQQIPKSDWVGRWIWLDAHPGERTNRTVHFRRSFHLAKAQEVLLRIAADTRYRLWLNGEWVGDGPGRAWPERYGYHLLDVARWAAVGENRLDIWVTHYGVGTFQTVNAEPGLLCEVWADGKVVDASDGTWPARPVPELESRVPRFGCQMGFEETFDARKAGDGAWMPANVLREVGCDAHQHLHCLDLPPMTREPRAFAGPLRMDRVRPMAWSTALRRDECFHKDFGSSAICRQSGLLQATFSVRHSAQLEWRCNFGAHSLLVDGRPLAWESSIWQEGVRTARCRVQAGGHTLTVLVCSEDNINDILLGCHAVDEAGFALMADDEGARWRMAEIEGDADQLQRAAADGAHVPWRKMPAAAEAFASPSYEIRCAEAAGSMPAVSGQGDLVVRTETGEAVLALYDLGEMSVGYLELRVHAGAGTVIELCGVEYIEEVGEPGQWIQHTANKQNGFRLICAEGENRWVSRDRRGMRYLLVMVREAPGPVLFRSIHMLEATYPAPPAVPFACSDAQLERIRSVSIRTLKLCMEDTFTDCPTYEQVTWIGDARNEALYNYQVFGCRDIVRRTLEIGAESLGRCELVCCFGPCDNMFEIPAWSFLWSIAVKEYAWYTGDRPFVEAMFPAVRLNLERALGRVDATGLFRGSGMLDWTPIDNNRPYVAHNQMFLCEALRTAADVADWLGLEADASAWRAARGGLAAELHRRLWVADREAYADSMDADGTLSPGTCRHTSALALLYDLAPEEIRAPLIRNLMTPPAGMTDVGSPFALQFIIEAMVHVGRPEAALALIRGDWSMMLEYGATTFWEMVHDEWRKGARRDPTRSHCHAWSCAPLDFIGRVLLGVRPMKPGFAEVEIHPSPCGLDFAEGEIPTPHGPLRVRWTRKDGRDLEVEIAAPEGVEVRAGAPCG